jgi:hypothetical protein
VPKPSTSVGEDGTNGTNGTNGTPKKGRAIAVPRPRHFEPDKDRALRAYLRHGTIVAGCKAAKVGRSTWYRWIDEDRAFAAAVAEVREEVADALEAEAIKRAKKGSDVLLIFLLKNKRRREFGERGPDRTGTITKHEAWHVPSRPRRSSMAGTSARSPSTSRRSRAGRSANLIINMPPRHMKSIASRVLARVGVDLPARVRWLFSSTRRTLEPRLGEVPPPHRVAHGIRSAGARVPPDGRPEHEDEVRERRRPAIASRRRRPASRRARVAIASSWTIRTT